MNERILLQFQKLCEELKLGELKEAPVSVTGGLLHQVYSLKTTVGRYAVKILNPEIMSRPTAMQNYITSERIANYAAKIINALPAKKFGGESIQKVGDQSYLIFDWVDGNSLKQNEITSVHCERMGSVLSSLHLADFSELDIEYTLSVNRIPTDWNFYLNKGQDNNAEWTKQLLENIKNLHIWNAAAIESANKLASEMVISHGDLESKNVMWSQNAPILIDWESAGYRNPMQDLIETAIYWSENESGNIDKGKFYAFLNSYKKLYGPIEANWSMILASGFLGKLDWLEYSLKRSLWIQCTDEKDQQAGTEQVTGTLAALRRYAETTSQIEEWLREI